MVHFEVTGENNRMNAQRQVLAIVNRKKPVTEELCGLSEASIFRWKTANGVPNDSEVLSLLLRIGDKLSFLATKSQEQVTDEYKRLSMTIEALTGDLRSAL